MSRPRRNLRSSTQASSAYIEPPSMQLELWGNILADQHDVQTAAWARTLDEDRQVLCMVKCKDTVWQVPKYLLCAQSSFFQGALEGYFKEATEGVIDLSEDNEQHLDWIMRHLLGRLPKNKLPNLINAGQHLLLVDLYALALRLDVGMFARMCAYIFEIAICLLVGRIQQCMLLSHKAKLSSVMLELGSIIEALYGSETEIPDHDQKLRVPLVKAAAWIRYLMTEDQQKSFFDGFFEISEAFRLQLWSHINFGDSTLGTT